MNPDTPPPQPNGTLEDGSVVRARTTGEGISNTYTRSSMESGTVASRPQVRDDDAGEGSEASERTDEAAARVAYLRDSEAESHTAMALLAAQEQERSRLAEELHDGPAQALANAIFQIEILDRVVRDNPAAVHEELASLRRMLERELDTLRGYINQLRPSLGEAAGLDDALHDSVDALIQRTGLPVEVNLEASADELHQAARTVVLRVAQEALRNVAKHAAATRAWLTTRVRTTPDGDRLWILEVGDDGRGFDYQSVAAHPNRRHFGLRFMRERADLLGSELSIETDPAAGTVVRLTIASGGERS